MGKEGIYKIILFLTLLAIYSFLFTFVRPSMKKKTYFGKTCLSKYGCHGNVKFDRQGVKMFLDQF